VFRLLVQKSDQALVLQHDWKHYLSLPIHRHTRKSTFRAPNRAVSLPSPMTWLIHSEERLLHTGCMVHIFEPKQNGRVLIQLRRHLFVFLKFQLPQPLPHHNFYHWYVLFITPAYYTRSPNQIRAILVLIGIQLLIVPLANMTHS
jgi:hypothetical protein